MVSDIGSSSAYRQAELELGSLIFSADDHLFEPKDTFTARVPSNIVNSVPHVVDYEYGEAWVIGDGIHPINAADGMGAYEKAMLPSFASRTANLQDLAAVGWRLEGEILDTPPPRTMEERLARGTIMRCDDFPPSVRDLDARVAAMDVDGVCVSVTIPSQSFGFAGQRLSMIANKEAGIACVRAYNDWLYEEVMGTYPERFVCSAVPWLCDGEVGAQEIYRNAERGFTATLFPENPERFKLPSIHNSEHWDPFFRACEETETVLNIHLGTGLVPMCPSSDSPLIVAKATSRVNPLVSTFDWIFSGIPVRFPDIKIAWTEGGIDWVPYVLGRIDTMGEWVTRGFWLDENMSPGDVFVRNFWFAALFDVGSYEYLGQRCPDHVMLETDYPHSDTQWPGSQPFFAERLRGLPDRLRRKFAYENAAALYRHAAA